MSRMTYQFWVICCALLLGWAGGSMAEDPGSTNGEIGAFFETITKARDAPPQNFALAIPGFSVDGIDYRLDCGVGTFRRNSEPFESRKGVKGTITADVQVCDREVEPIACTGVLRVLERKFKTDVGGFTGSGVNITAEQLGAVLDGLSPSEYAIVLVTSRFGNGKKIGASTLGCHIGPAPSL